MPGLAVRAALVLLAVRALPSRCAKPVVIAEVVEAEQGGMADFDMWLGECPYDSNSSCRGLVQAVKGGRVLDSFVEDAFTLIASGMNRMFALTSTYTYTYSADGQHDYEALNMRYFTSTSDKDVLCEQATVFQLKKADGLVYAPVNGAVDSEDAFGLSFFKDGQRGNKLWVKPYALQETSSGVNATLPVLTLTILPTTVLSRITKRACNITEINAGQVGCFDYILRKTRHEKLVLNISVHTVKSAGGGHNPVEKECWTAYSFDQGMLADTSASVKSGTATLRLSWLLVAAMIGLTLIMGRR